MALTPVQHQISSAVTVTSTINLSNSDYIAICAGIIAACALFATIYQAYLTREHNRLSVRPHLEITKLFFIGKPASITVINHGLGPAIVTSLIVCYDGKEYPLNDENSFKAFLGIFNIDSEIFILEREAVIGVGCEVILFRHKNPLTSQMYQSLVASWDKIKVKGNYRSIYNIEYKL